MEFAIHAYIVQSNKKQMLPVGSWYNSQILEINNARIQSTKNG